MVQCVYWPIMLGYYTMDDLTTATNLWEFISTHAPKSRSFLYDGGTLDSRKITIFYNVYVSYHDKVQRASN